MPSSANRHRLEIPTALYARLEDESQRRQVTAAALATALLTDALDSADRERGGAGEMKEMLRQLLDGSARQTAELRALRRELVRGRPQLRTAQLARGATATDAATALESQDWAELRVAGQGAHGEKQVFGDALAGAALPPAATEYLRLLLVGDLTQSADLREAYLRRAEALRAQLAMSPSADSSGADDGERRDDAPAR